MEDVIDEATGIKIDMGNKNDRGGLRRKPRLHPGVSFSEDSSEAPDLTKSIPPNTLNAIAKNENR